MNHDALKSLFGKNRTRKSLFCSSFKQKSQRMGIWGPTNIIINESQQVASRYLEPCHPSLSKNLKT